MHSVPRRPRLVAAALLVALGLLACSPGVAAAAGPAEIRLEHCLVSLIDDVLVPAQEEGLLAEACVREGARVAAGQVLARIDDGQAQLERRVVLAEEQVARQKAASDVHARAAEAARRVADSELRLNLQANRRYPGARSQVELERLQLSVDQAALQLEQAEHEAQVARLESQAYTARAALADDELARRRIVAPLAGQVVQVYPQAGQWVRPGEPVARLVRLDRLRIEGFLQADEHLPADVADRPVEVAVLLPGRRRETFSGRIVFVSPLVDPGGDYRVWAEVDNRRQAGQWLLRPGLEVDMTIDQHGPPAGQAADDRAE